jgi:hypothetical protein
MELHPSILHVSSDKPLSKESVEMLNTMAQRVSESTITNKTMNTSEQIDDILNGLAANSRGQIRGKTQANNKLLAMQLKAVDSALMDVRVYVAQLSTAYSTKEALKLIDEFIYKKQIE